MNRQSDRDRIAEEAVGQRHGSAPPYAEGKAGMSQEEAARQLAPSSGAQASTPEKTAESVGERVGDAYSDPHKVEQHPKSNTGRLTARGTGSHDTGESSRFLSVGRKVTENLSRPLFEERLLTVIGGFALGYLTALLLHGRINAYFDTTPGPFQIAKPPQGRQHPRGFVQSTVLKTITEHPQRHDNRRDHRSSVPRVSARSRSRMRSTHLLRRKKSARRAGNASICPRRLRCRPHRISRAHSRSRAETNAFQRPRFQPTTVGDRQTDDPAPRLCGEPAPTCLALQIHRRHCQLKRLWYARRVGGAAARVGELLCSPIMLPRSSRAGPEKSALGPLS
jgi:hypothetical protein